MTKIQFKLMHDDKLTQLSDEIQQAYNVKFKRSIKAKISHYKSDKWRVYINGLCWDKSSLEDCKAQIIENYSSFLDAIGKPAEIEIVN